MNRLPEEILVDIFSRLSFKDKLQCTLTCHGWYTKISSSVLYAEISFKYPQSNIQSKAKIKSMYDQGLGLQIVDLRVRDINDPLELSKLCPNLKSLHLREWMYGAWMNKNNISLAENWKKLEVINEAHSRYLLTMKLLDSPMMYLTSISIGFYDQPEEVLPRFFQKLRHAPALEYLCLVDVFGINFKRLDLLHENSPNLKHLELKYVDYLFVEEVNSLDEDGPISPPSVASSLRSISASVTGRYNCEIVPYDREIKGVHWIEYICRKYPNLTSITVPSITILQSQLIKDVVTNLLQKAFCNWVRLTKFDMQPVFLSKDILEAMDNCNISLESLKVYIDIETDKEQFINLAHSKQRNNISELIIVDKSEIWIDQQCFDYFLQSPSRTNCQLKAIVMDVNNSRENFDDDFTIVLPTQVLHYIPSLQRLSMTWIVTRDINCILLNQTIQLTQLDLALCHLNYHKHILDYNELECNTLKHIQDIVYRSPLLQTVTIYLYSNNTTLDFQQNTKLKYFNCLNLLGIGLFIKTTQSNYYETILKKEFEEYDNTITLRLPSNIHSIFINSVKRNL